MFTGLVTARGRIARITPAGDTLMVIVPDDAAFPLSMGASIACNGICLTVVAIEDGAFHVQLSAETLRVTTAGDWREGDLLNLEPSLAVGDRLGGHFVSGHVDGLAHVERITPSGESHVWEFSAPAALMKFIAAKGSITLDGVSLTVNTVAADRFGVNIIPHTAQVTSFGTRREGAAINLEVDLLARYVARLQEGPCAS